MKTSEKGLVLIKQFEGLHLNAYPCSAHVLTIGYGHTAGVQPGDTITRSEADELLELDISESERSVGRYVTFPLTLSQFDALVSFTFNLGSGNLRISMLLKMLNAEDYSGAAEEFLRWTHAGGKENPGLARRKKLFLRLRRNPEREVEQSLSWSRLYLQTYSAPCHPGHPGHS